MVEVCATIRNALGIHCRPSAVIVRETCGYAGEIWVEGTQGGCDPRSIIHLIALGLEPGSGVKIRVSGPDEEAFARRLVELFERNFDFAPNPGSISPLRGSAGRS